MPARLPLLSVLLLLAVLLMATGVAHSAPLPAVPNPLFFEEPFEEEAEEEGEEVETECDIAFEESDEGALSEEEAEKICAEEDAEAQPAAKARQGKARTKAKHRARQRKKACRHKAPARKKQRCSPGRRGR